MQSKAEQKFLQLLRKPTKTKEEILEKERVRLEFEEELKQETKDLINELKAVGIEINAIYDLVNTKAHYPSAIPILIRHLSRNYHDKNKEGIIRALAVKEAVGKATHALIEEYNKIPKEKMDLRWVIGNTIYSTIISADIENILSIVQNKGNGMSRQPFVAALGKMKSENVENVLIKLLDDKEITPYVIIALGKMKSIKAKGKIEKLLTSTERFVKKEAEKAMKRIEGNIKRNRS